MTDRQVNYTSHSGLPEMLFLGKLSCGGRAVTDKLKSDLSTSAKCRTCQNYRSISIGYGLDKDSGCTLSFAPDGAAPPPPTNTNHSKVFRACSRQADAVRKHRVSNFGGVWGAARPRGEAWPPAARGYGAVECVRLGGSTCIQG